MIQFETNAADDAAKVDMTPMVDVIFTIIAFMMLIINAPVATLGIDLPQSEDGASAETEKSFVTVLVEAGAPLWRIDGGEPVGREQVASAIMERADLDGAAPPTLIVIAEDAPVQRMIDTLDLLRELGVTDTQVALDSASQE